MAVIYMILGSDLTYNYLAGGAFGKRISKDSKNPAFRFYHRIHANIDPNMRAEEPVLGYKKRLPAWTIGLCSTNAILTIGVEIVLIIALAGHLFGKGSSSGAVSDLVRFVATVFIVRSIIEIIYGLELKHNPVNDAADYPSQTFAGIRLSWRRRYDVIAFIPQVYIPFLIAERFYAGTWAYSFDWARMLIFLLIPTTICAWASAVLKSSPRE